MSEISEAIRLQTDVYKRQLAMLCLDGTSRFHTMFCYDLDPVAPKLETPLSPELHMAAGYIALIDVEQEEGVTRTAVPFLDAKRNGGTTEESMRNNAFNLVDSFIQKHKISIPQQADEHLLVGTYSFRAKNKMVATIAKTWDSCGWLREPAHQEAISHLSASLGEVELCMRISRYTWLRAKYGRCDVIET